MELESNKLNVNNQRAQLQMPNADETHKHLATVLFGVVAVVAVGLRRVVAVVVHVS